MWIKNLEIDADEETRREVTNRGEEAKFLPRPAASPASIVERMPGAGTEPPCPAARQRVACRGGCPRQRRATPAPLDGSPQTAMASCRSSSQMRAVVSSMDRSLSSTDRALPHAWQ